MNRNLLTVNTIKTYHLHLSTSEAGLKQDQRLCITTAMHFKLTLTWIWFFNTAALSIRAWNKAQTIITVTRRQSTKTGRSAKHSASGNVKVLFLLHFLEQTSLTTPATLFWDWYTVFLEKTKRKKEECLQDKVKRTKKECFQDYTKA